MSFGMRIYREIDRPDPELLQQFTNVSTADLSDAMSMANTMDKGIGPAFLPATKIVGPAVTISVPTGAQSVRKIGMAASRPGDVIVINASGALNYAMIGDNIGRGLLHRGVAGLVIDGAYRDPSEFRRLGLPIFARGQATLPGPKEGPGEVNVPICCGGVVVNPGDIIVADEDGIVVIPPEHAREILVGASKVAASFQSQQEQLLQGAVTGVEAIERRLREGGWQFVDAPYGSRH